MSATFHPCRYCGVGAAGHERDEAGRLWCKSEYDPQPPAPGQHTPHCEARRKWGDGECECRPEPTTDAMEQAREAATALIWRDGLCEECLLRYQDRHHQEESAPCPMCGDGPCPRGANCAGMVATDDLLARVRELLSDDRNTHIAVDLVQSVLEQLDSAEQELATARVTRDSVQLKLRQLHTVLGVPETVFDVRFVRDLVAMHERRRFENARLRQRVEMLEAQWSPLDIAVNYAGIAARFVMRGLQ